jgi:glycosyltransferase involved in cell wall biosynthesis
VKILFHCVYFPPEVGGLESHVYYLARALVALGHETAVVTSRSLPGLPAEEDMEGIRVVRTWFPSRSPLGWTAHALGSLPRTRALARRADIIHAQAFPSVVPGVAGRRASGAPLVATFHTSHFLVRAKKALWRPILGALVRAPDHALAASQEIARVAESLAPGTRVEALANGVETGFFRRVEPSLPDAGVPRIVVPRRLFPKNGVEFLVRAMPHILREGPVQAVLIGDGPERGRLEALAAELGVAAQVTFMGKRPHGDMPGLLSSGSLAVIPSLMEATSVAALEAMACELPVVASRVGGLPEIVDDEVGRLFEPGDPEALARAVLAVLQGGDLPALGARARERVVDQWSNHRLAARHLEIYEELLGRRGSGP